MSDDKKAALKTDDQKAAEEKAATKADGKKAAEKKAAPKVGMTPKRAKELGLDPFPYGG